MFPVLHSMEVLGDAEARTLTFSINLLAPSAIDQVRVAVLLEKMFDGERFGIGRFMHVGDKPFGVIGLRFPNIARYADAKAFCDAKLTKSGMMRAGDRALLDKADRGTSIAASIMRVIYDQPFSERPRVREKPPLSATAGDPALSRPTVGGSAAPVH